MAIDNFPAALVPIIQTNYLERRFEQALRSKLVYRQIADRETFANRQGETVTKTRAGLKAPVTTPLTPSANTNFDNGLTATTFAVEQYTLTLNMYGDTIDLNTVTDRVGIASQFVQNAVVNGVQAAQTIDRLARDALFNAYMGGDTWVTATLGSPGAAVAVDDIRGFQFVYVNGVRTATSASHTLACTVNGTSYTLNTAVADVSNTSVAPGGISGVLTFSTSVSTANATIPNRVLATNASTIIRPSARATSQALQSTDVLTMSVLLDAVATLRKNNVPTVGGFYNLYCDPVSARQLFADSDLKQLFRAMNDGMPGEFRNAMISDFLGLRFLTTTEAYTQALSGVGTIRRPIVCGAGALVEGVFEGMNARDVAPGDSIVSVVDDVAMVTREPLDRFQQIIAQSWYTVTSFAAPSDTVTTTSIIPTATNAAYKRAVVLETIG